MVQHTETLPRVEGPARPLRERLWRQTLVRLVKKKPLGLFGGGIVLLLIILAVFANWIAPFPYNEMHLRDRLKPSSGTYLMGTDNMGRDIFSRIVYGARVSMVVGLGTVSLGTGLATVIGVLSAYFGGRIDTYTQRLVDAWQAFPWLIILLTIMAIIGPGMGNVILALGILIAASGSRVIRSAVLSIREQQYIEAALSFLGFGVPPPHPSWGEMLSGSGRNYMYKAPRDLLDPRLRGDASRST